MLLSNLILYGTLVACVIVTALIVRRYDLYDREPWWLLTLATLLGATGMWAAGVAQVWVIEAMNRRGHVITDGELATLAGSVEEGFKFGVVVIVALVWRAKFNDALDGIIYGSFAGLGAAIEESVHVLTQSAPSQYLPPQEPIRLAGHLVMGGIGCFGLGLLTMPRKSGRVHAIWAIPASLGAAVLLHTFWDVIAFDATVVFRGTSQLRMSHTVTPVAIMLIGMLIYRGLVAWGVLLTRYTHQFCDVATRTCPPPLE